MRQRLGMIGGVITSIYLIGLGALVWERVGQLHTRPLNEIGDFLAGVFGPAAFLWLVLGFLQQGEELRQGTEVLKLQATELREIEIGCSGATAYDVETYINPPIGGTSTAKFEVMSTPA
ncbi:hypothetical protein [Pseudomonas sp. AP3_22 TE3818]